MIIWGVVYIFENVEAQRIKVGITINPTSLKWGEGGLKDANDIWLERVGKCQICGTRLQINQNGFLNEHRISGSYCLGGTCPPLELSTSLAESYLIELQEQNGDTRRINTLKKRISLYKNKPKNVGRWELRVLYYKDNPELLEKEAHKLLDNYLDHNAPMGEIFACSVSTAREAVENVLDVWGELDSIKIEVSE